MNTAVLTTLTILLQAPLAQMDIPPVPMLPGQPAPAAPGGPPAMVNPMEGMAASAASQEAVPVDAPGPWYNNSFLADPIFLIIMLVLAIGAGVAAYLFVFKDR